MASELSQHTDTIAAVATGAGFAGIGVVRVSGPQASHIAHLLTGQNLKPRHAHYLPFLSADSSVIDEGLALLFTAPHSYTGEDVLELQGHGGPVVLNMVLSRVLECGARQARPGEFTERAFLNNKMDLTQAEAVADLIESSSASAAQAAVRSMSGAFSTRVHHIQQELTALRAWLEAALDFSEEEIDFLSSPELQQRAVSVVEEFEQTIARAEQGQRLRDGMTLVIAGVTNAGKSSLLNALSGEQSAIVTDIAGTTRDTLHEHITLDGVPLHVVDTAGLRKTSDPVELEGIKRAKQAVASADHVIVMLDAEQVVMPELDIPDHLPVTMIVNKVDVMNAKDSAVTRDSVADAVAQCCKQVPGVSVQDVLYISAKHGTGMEALQQKLLAHAGHDANLEGTFIARKRHLDALSTAQRASIAALERLRSGDMPELAAEELRQAQLALDSVTGRFDSEDLLGEIFGAFCIGK